MPVPHFPPRKIMQPALQQYCTFFLLTDKVCELFYNMPWELLTKCSKAIFYYTHPTKGNKVTITKHKDDLKKKTAESALKQAGIKK